MAGKNDRGMPGMEERGGERRGGNAWVKLMSSLFPTFAGGMGYLMTTGKTPEDILPTPLPHEPITTYGGETGVPLGEPIATYGGEGGVPIGGAKKAPYKETDMPFQRPGMSGGRTYDMRPKENLNPETGLPEFPGGENLHPGGENLPYPEKIMKDIFELEARDNFMGNPDMRRRGPDSSVTSALATALMRRRNPEGIEFPED